MRGTASATASPLTRGRKSRTQPARRPAEKSPPPPSVLVSCATRRPPRHHKSCPLPSSCRHVSQHCGGSGAGVRHVSLPRGARLPACAHEPASHHTGKGHSRALAFIPPYRCGTVPRSCLCHERKLWWPAARSRHDKVRCYKRAGHRSHACREFNPFGVFWSGTLARKHFLRKEEGRTTRQGTASHRQPWPRTRAGYTDTPVVDSPGMRAGSPGYARVCVPMAGYAVARAPEAACLARAG